MAKKIQSITIIGKKWFQKSFGNTYFSATGIVDGVIEAEINFEYGYGDQYIQSIEELLQEKEIISPKQYTNGSSEPLREYCHSRDIQLTCSVTQVSRKRDL